MGVRTPLIQEQSMLKVSVKIGDRVEVSISIPITLLILMLTHLIG